MKKPKVLYSLALDQIQDLLDGKDVHCHASDGVRVFMWVSGNKVLIEKEKTG